MNDGKGNFRIGGTYGDPKWPTRNAAVGDLNGDGYPDIVVANRMSTSYYCLNDGKLHFDFMLHDGIVTKSNGIELMRSIGLDV